VKTAIYPIEQDLISSIRQHLADLVLDTRGNKHGDKVLVGLIKKTKKAPRKDVLRQLESDLCSAFVTTVVQERRQELQVKEFFSMFIQGIDVNWHADELKPGHVADEFPLFVCLRHSRWGGDHPHALAKQPGFALNAFFSMDSITMVIRDNEIVVNRDEIYDDLDVLSLRYDTLP
jgi:hypothetical protein